MKKICVKCMHIGSYDNEPTTINLMHEYMIENGYELDITDTRFHHEIYLSAPRRCEKSKLKEGHVDNDEPPKFNSSTRSNAILNAKSFKKLID